MAFTTPDGELPTVESRRSRSRSVGGDGLVGKDSKNGFGSVAGMILDILGGGVGMYGTVRCEVSSFGLSPGGGIPSRTSDSSSYCVGRGGILSVQVGRSGRLSVASGASI
jgi:hypothetical protein